MHFRARIFARVLAPLLAVATGAVALADTPLAAMPMGAIPASAAQTSPQAEPARLVCNRRHCWHTYGYYRPYYRHYYGYGYRPYYYGLPGIGIRVY